MDFKLKALEEFVNDEVETVENGLYKWRGKHYQVLLYNRIGTRGMSRDSFIKYELGKRVYGIREMSKELLEKWYMLRN